MIKIKDIYSNYDKMDGKEVNLSGWIRNIRTQKEFGFINLNDGSFFETIQLVYTNELKDFDNISKLRVGSSINIKGNIVLTPNNKQPFEIKVQEVTLLGNTEENYPIQPKRHTREFLREQAHLRSRTNLFTAVFRLRSVAAHAIHTFFQDRDFIYVNTPIITANDAEGAGEVFKVTTLDLNNIPKDEDKNVDFKKDFFEKQVGLAVTGQLEAEAFAHSFRDVYTFGPTFRSENSNTSRHASEFWMIEPEMAFCNLEGNMNVAEDLVKHVIKTVLDKCKNEMNFFNSFVEKGIIEKLKKIANSSFNKVTHKEAIDLLKVSRETFQNTPDYDKDLATEHEKYLTKHFNGPVFVIDWPKEIKSFYMKLNDDNKTVAAMDLLVPGSGELIGGSSRENNLEKLETRMKELNIPVEGLEWYVDLRKQGGVETSGFGLGFERLIMYLTGVENIRDVIPFPRTPRNCEF